MTNKQMEEEQESVSQQVRNWNGSDIVFENIIQRLNLLRKAKKEANKTYSTIEGAILQTYAANEENK